MRKKAKTVTEEQFDFGKITMVDNFPIEIDENKLSDKYWTRVPNKSFILKKYHLENQVPRGVTINHKVSVRIDIIKGDN